MKLVPRRASLVIKPDAEEEDQKVGSLYIPEKQWSMHPDVLSGTVVSVGEDCRELKEGLHVMVGRFSGVKLDIDEVEHMLVDEEDVIAIMEGE